MIIITIIIISDFFFSIVSLYTNLAHSSDMLRNTRTSMGEIWDRTGVGKSLAQVIKSQVNIWLIVFVTQHIIFHDDYQKWRWMKHKSRPYAEFLAVGEAYKAKLWPTPGFKERTFDSCGFSAKGFLISASVVP